MSPHRYIVSNQKRLLCSLVEMVRINTENPPGRNYGAMVDLLARHCSMLGMSVVVHQVPQIMVDALLGEGAPPRYNIIARWDTGASETVHFNAHYDVVPATGTWRCGEPFAAGVINDAIYGRGCGDMKGSIAALLMAVEAVQRGRGNPSINVECSFTADEEIGGELGAGYVVRQKLVDASYAVVCEGASGIYVGHGHNGVLWLEVEILGKPAHASNPQMGINAFEAMCAATHVLQEYRIELAAPSRQYLDHAGQERSPTINIGGVFGGGPGEKVNTVPARAVFSIDRRLVPGETLKKAEQELRKVLEGILGGRRGLKYRLRVPLRIEPCIVDPCHALPTAFASAVQAVRRRAVGFRTTSGFTDLHYFVEEGGMSGIGYGVRGESAHGTDERVRIRDLIQTARTYAQFIMMGLG